MAGFELLDLSQEKWEEFYKNNKAFCENTRNWFYLKNDKFVPKRLGHMNIVDPFNTRGQKFCSFAFPQEGGSAIVLVGDFDGVKELKNQAKQYPDKLIRFDLKDGIGAGYLSVVKLDGKEKVGFVICNDLDILDLPFSANGETRYSLAVKEKNTLPSLVKKGAFEKLLPLKYKEMLGIKDAKKSAKKKDDGKSK